MSSLIWQWIFAFKNKLVKLNNIFCLMMNFPFLKPPHNAVGFHLDDDFVCFSPHSVINVSLPDPCFAVLQILMYDIRSNKPLLLKDHMYGLPIRNIAFHKGQDLVLSCDTRILKLWERETVSGVILVFTSLSSHSKELLIHEH